MVKVGLVAILAAMLLWALVMAISDLGRLVILAGVAMSPAVGLAWGRLRREGG
jgi:hypothetical protein